MVFLDKTKRRKFSLEERSKILLKTGCKCGHCGKSLTSETMTVEHIYPIDKGGTHSEFNLIALCKDCNYSKSNSTYEVNQYYKYILPEYMKKFVEYNQSMHLKNSDTDAVLQLSSKVYDMIPGNMLQMLTQTMMRNKKKAEKLASQVSIKFKLEKAYEGDANDILKFLEKTNKKCGIDYELYNNDYKIANAVYEGQVYLLINPANEIHGVFIFKYSKLVNTEFGQLRAVEDTGGFREVYIMTLAAINPSMIHMINYIVQDFIKDFLTRKIMPLFFNILTSDKYDISVEYLKLPCEIEGKQGNLEFFNLSGMREIIRRIFSKCVNSGKMTESELDDIVEKLTQPVEDYELNNINNIDKLLEGIRHE